MFVLFTDCSNTEKDLFYGVSRVGFEMILYPKILYFRALERYIRGIESPVQNNKTNVRPYTLVSGG